MIAVIKEMNFRNAPQTTENVHNWLNWCRDQWCKNGFGDWMIYERTKDGSMFIGRCGLRDYEDTNNLELATALVEHARGRGGLGLEARRFAVTHAFRNSTREKIVSFIAHGNARAERAAQKLGLRYIEDRIHYGKLWKYHEMGREEYFSQPHHQITSADCGSGGQTHGA
ncbi:RimJ/RimL family protein N-acetyltransferase [Bradyrhizobium yuanmingense]|uniref:GNAT family N-acetyltransferase n=1 Tax=Bradyrhizobium yuanmingense TaxID=108015 RepID=UPI003515EAC3